MTARARRWCLVAALSCALVAAPAIAQDATQGTDMPQLQPPAKQPAQPAGTKRSPVPGKPPQQATPAAHSMTAMEGSAVQPPPKPTGVVQQLDIGSEIGVRPVVRGLNLESMQMDTHGMPMQRGKAPPDSRSADYSDGIGHGSMTGMDMRDDAPLGMLLLDQLEYFDSQSGNGVFLDAQGWYGSDANKVWLKAEGERSAGHLQDLRTELSWDRPVAAFWDTQIGVRHDFGVGPGRNWAAFGVQGLAPYWFDVEATFYVGPAGRSAFRFQAEYELLLTQRLILQPRLEMNVYGRDDPRHGIGTGLSDAELGVRLRYAFSRKFAPYVGVEFDRKFGSSADFARSTGGRAFDPRMVAGVRLRF